MTSNALTFCLFFILSNFCSSWAQNNPEAIVDAGILGRIEGQISTTIGRSSRSYIQFLGIPYAKQPTRFMPAELHEEPLNGTESPFYANQFGSECSQPQGSGTENCLFLNLFTPQVTNSSLKYPVLVFIHGAAFVSGNANRYTGARLLNKDIVLITFNYRLGVFGFYNLETPNAPGNAALYDALTALKWVQTFVHHFGGDPTQVTLAGQSSGSATVSHLVLSPLTKGLFHRAIAASGSALDVWATSSDPLTASLQVAGYAGCINQTVTPNKTEIMECMLNKDQSVLIGAQNMFQFLDMKSGSIGVAHVSPSVQKTSSTVIPAVVPQHPATVLESGTQNNVSLMMGATRDDGGFTLRVLLDGYMTPNQLMNDTFFIKNKLVPAVFKSIGISDPANTIANTFSDIYIEDAAGQSGNISLMVPSLIDMLGVLFFKSGAYQSAQYHSQITSDTYYYSFEYEGRYTLHPNGTFPGGVAHADDLQYLFQMTNQLNEEEQTLSDIMVDYWVNFIYTGNPNKYPTGDVSNATVPNWPELESTKNEYIIIDSKIQTGNNYPQSWVIDNRKEEILCKNSASTTFNAVKLVFQLSSVICVLALNV